MRTPEEILAFTGHRPWPFPDKPWLMIQQWSNLLFAHWALPPQLVRPLIPPELELDLFDGMAWVGLTPFQMTHIQLRGLPPIPGVRDFLEMNLRTYVRLPLTPQNPNPHQTKPGIWFFSLDASNLPAVVGARIGLGLPYFWANMETHTDNNHIHYQSQRKTTPAEADLRYTPGNLITQKSALERYCLYEVRLGVPIRTQIHHLEWPLRHAHATFAVNTVGIAHNLPLTTRPDLLHFSQQLDVLVFPPD